MLTTVRGLLYPLINTLVDLINWLGKPHTAGPPILNFGVDSVELSDLARVIPQGNGPQPGTRRPSSKALLPSPTSHFRLGDKRGRWTRRRKPDAQGAEDHSSTISVALYGGCCVGGLRGLVGWAQACRRGGSNLELFGLTP